MDAFATLEIESFSVDRSDRWKLIDLRQGEGHLANANGASLSKSSMP